MMNDLQQIAKRLDNEDNESSHFITLRLFGDGSGSIAAIATPNSLSSNAEREIWRRDFESTDELNAFLREDVSLRGMFSTGKISW